MIRPALHEERSSAPGPVIQDPRFKIQAAIEEGNLTLTLTLALMLGIGVRGTGFGFGLGFGLEFGLGLGFGFGLGLDTSLNPRRIILLFFLHSIHYLFTLYTSDGINAASRVPIPLPPFYFVLSSRDRSVENFDSRLGFEWCVRKS